MSILRYAWIRAGVSLYFSASVFLSAIVMKGIHPESYFVGKPDPLVIGLILMAVFFGLFAVLLNMKNEELYSRVFIISSIVIMTSILAVGVFLYFNFLRIAFHAAAQLYLIYLYKHEIFGRKKRKKESLRVIYFITLFITAASLAWVFFFGYHGIILNAPTAKPWMILNLYTIGIVFISLDAILSLYKKMYRQVLITADSLLVDNHDFTQLLGQKDLEVLSVIANRPSGNVSCASILEKLSPENDPQAIKEKCETCIREKYKATLCPDYKRIYNQILKIKNILETMRIGTILSPENKMNITREGWTLLMFAGVRIQLQKE